LTSNKIERKEKTVMRQHLERLAELQREMDRLIDNCSQEVEAAEYVKFLEDLKKRNLETIRILTDYMVRKCNR
jgi:hypothetical protein